MKCGIDISEHNGNARVAIKDAEFVMIRASWGHFEKDKKVDANVAICQELGKPFGFYHFSYARNYKEGKQEASDFMKLIKQYKGRTYPVALDLEWDDGVNWKKSNGITYETEMEVLKAWKEVVEQEYGDYLILYCNKSFYNQLAKVNLARLKTVDLWLAEWGVAKPSISCGMWQYRGYPLDLDQSFTDYPTVLKNMKGTTSTTEPKLKVGGKAKVKRRYNYGGVQLIKEVMSTTFKVVEIKGDRVVLAYPKGGTEAFYKNDVIAI